jgi:hypothetical protein
MPSIIRAMRSRDTAIALGLVALAVVVPAIAGIASGAILVPHNDDFAYRRPALGLLETGRLELTGWAVMTLVGLLAANLPLLWLAGGSAWAFAATTAIFAVIGIVAGYSLARRVLSPGRAGLAVLLSVLVPGFLVYTTSFMTEVPSIAMEMSCLAIGAVALGRTPETGRWRWLAAALVVGCYAFSIREYALAAPVAVLVADVASERRGRWLPYVFALVAVVAVCAAIYRFTDGLPGAASASLNPPTPGTTRRVMDAVGVLSLPLAPAILLAGVAWVPAWRRSEHRVGAVVGAVVGLAAAGWIYSDQLVTRFGGRAGSAADIFVGNVFDVHGSTGAGILAGGRPTLYVAPTWDVLNTVALLATIGAAGLLGATLVAERERLLRALEIRSRPTPLGTVPGMLVAFVVLFAGGTIVTGLTVILFDRYTWPLALPLAILLLLRPRPGPRSAPAPATVPGGPKRAAAILAAGLVALAATTSLVLMLNAAAFDGARWRMGEEAVRLGFAPDTVDAGLEWVGLHATGLVELTAGRRPSMTEYAPKFPSFRQCAVASSSPLDDPGFTLVLTRPDAYRLLLFAGPVEPMYLYRVAAPGCPVGP